MCARFTLRAAAPAVADLFNVDEVPEMPPRFNIAPTQPVIGIVGRRGGGRALKYLQWGLIPSWAKDPAIGQRLINARAENLTERPAFRNAYRWRRCLVPADGFYEWMEIEDKDEGGGMKDEEPSTGQLDLFGDKDLKKITKKAKPTKPKVRKQPYYIGLKDFSIFAFAGLWERWDPEGLGPLETCTIITTEPNGLVRPMHDRMPVILRPEDYDLWLNREVESPDALTELLGPYPEDEMTAYPVSTAVNSANHETPECVAPLED
jgi:putative SOS response-associated peptidase YedK